MNPPTTQANGDRPQRQFSGANHEPATLSHEKSHHTPMRRLIMTNHNRHAEQKGQRQGNEAAQSDGELVGRAKTHSSFAELRRSLVDASAVAEFIQKNYTGRLRDPKQLNNFFQALSNRPETIFTEFCGLYKKEVCLMLERMLEVYSTATSTSAVPISPAAHEFIIRCEQNGVRRMTWADELTQTNGTQKVEKGEEGEEGVDAKASASASGPVPVLLFSPRELIKKVANVEPRGRLERMIEMSTTTADLESCARKLQTVATPAQEGKKNLEYAAVCRLLSKLASKTRRTCEAIIRTATEAGKLPVDDLSALDQVIGTLLAVTQRSFSERPPVVQQHPIAKLSNLVKWCNTHNLLQYNADKYSALVEALEKQSSLELHAQAAQLETVLLLKGLQPGDDAAATETLQKLWNESLGRYEPCSADVLSSIAVVCRADGISDTLRTRVAQRLVLTQQCVQRERKSNETILPRRALSFVLAEQSKEKRDAVKRMLAKEENKKRGRD